MSSVPEPVDLESTRTEDKVVPLDEKLEEVYDIDEEVLEDEDIGEETELLDKLEKTAPDTFSVKDINEEPPSVEKFAKGYRVQVFASSDLEKAKEFKKKLMAGTGLAVYIDYEGGLYKVRAGDFSGREGASDARVRLAEEYPDCWIVKTTIRK
ncbi:MAG: SPOR domain-containing protein [Candidatus Krumholzibacteria bacterium]|nr:SPOR domain-containing protein [Candidatus Krumholzibacteria bacterium]